MDYAASELRSVAKNVDEQTILDMMPKGYADRFGPTVSRNPERRFQYNRERKRKQQVAHNYKPHAILPGMQRRGLNEVTSSGMGGIRGLGVVSGSPAVYQAAGEGQEDNSYFGKNIQTADQRTDQILQRLKQHTALHSSGQMRSGHSTHGFSKEHTAVHQGKHTARVKGLRIRRK